MIHELLREFGYAFRQLCQRPAFTVAAVLTLALAIGTNASMFAVVERVVLNPLPYPASDRLIQLDHGFPALKLPSGVGMTTGLYQQYRERARTLDGVAIYRTDEATLTAVGEPQRLRVTNTTPTLMSVLRTPPAIGRWFTDAEGTVGSPQVAVLSHSLWMRQYGGDARVLGQGMSLNGVATEIVGVMPASFAFPDPRTDVWIAQQVAPPTGLGVPFRFLGVARLRDGATLSDARTELNSVIADLPKAYPGDPGVSGNIGPGGLTSALITLKEATVGQVERALWMLLASVGLVLLIACANVANLFLVRTESRQREVAVRRALGLSSSGMARLFLTESLLLSVASGVLGLALASSALGLLVRYAPANLPRIEEIRLDSAVIALTFTVTLLIALAFGMMPLARKAPLAMFLHEGGRSTTPSPHRHRVRHMLMGGQIALALVLLVSSGLMVRSLQKLRTLDPGFDASSTLTFRIGLPNIGYSDREAVVRAHQKILDRLSVIPGVKAVSASSGVPLQHACFGNSVSIEGRPIPPNTAPPAAVLCATAGNYVEAMGMRLLRGREIERGDIERGEQVAMVNQAFADLFLKDVNPIGQRVRSNAPPAVNVPPWLTIVGVVPNTPVRALSEARPTPLIYMPMSIAGGPNISPAAMLGPNVATMNYIVRSAGPSVVSMEEVRLAINSVDSNLAIAQMQTLEDILDRGSGQMSFTMVLLTIAAAAALMLGVVGIYGVVSYIVSQRTAEIGIRIALGAEPRTVRRMIVAQSGRVALVGISVGIAAAAAGGRFIESLLYGVSPRDPAVFLATALSLLAVAVIACWLPARRAARLNPIDVLRMD